LDCSLKAYLRSGRQEFCEFRFFTETETDNYVKLGQSDRITVTDAKKRVSSLHLSLTETSNSMRVSWTSASSGSPQAIFSTDPDFSSPSTSDGSCKTYKQSDMCESPATTETSFVDPGMLCTAVMDGLEPDTKYYYKVTSDGETFSDPVSFLSAPPTDDPDYSFSFITYGDMGMWSGENGEASIATASISTAQVNDHGVRRIDHFGDISYARGVSGTWDAWFDLIEPYASQVPYMITIGNHEFDYSEGNGENDPSGEERFSPSWWNGGSDSGGECR
jgi:acid phosphatase type 7